MPNSGRSRGHSFGSSAAARTALGGVTSSGYVSVPPSALRVFTWKVYVCAARSAASPGALTSLAVTGSGESSSPVTAPGVPDTLSTTTTLPLLT